MSNTINVNYMTRACNQYQQKIVAKDQEKCRLPRLLTQQGLTTIERVDDAG